jgi:D-3-phosphoglycerate dehydrogenase
LPRDELLARIADYDALIGRSATRITDELLRRAKRLRVIGRAGVGVDNIALDSATELGIAVINAPAGNTNAVVELVFGSLVGLLRHIPRAHPGNGRTDRPGVGRCAASAGRGRARRGGRRLAAASGH